MMNKKTFIFLHLSLLIYSLSSIASKLASYENFFSFKYIFYVILMVAILGIYAILWQQILKKVKLNIAFANKGITIVWAMLIGYMFFNEKLSSQNIVGSIIVVFGIVLLNLLGEKS